MKRICALLLALLLLCAAAYAETLADGQNSSADASVTVQGTSGPVVAVEVNWGDMQFTYHQGGWDPVSHTTVARGSIIAVDNSNYVTVKNHSNVAVSITCRATELPTGVAAAVDGGTDTAIQPLEACPEGGSAPEHTFRVTFTADDTFTPSGETSTLGKITVSVSAQ